MPNLSLNELTSLVIQNQNTLIEITNESFLWRLFEIGSPLVIMVFTVFVAIWTTKKQISENNKNVQKQIDQNIGLLKSDKRLEYFDKHRRLIIETIEEVWATDVSLFKLGNKLKHIHHSIFMLKQVLEYKKNKEYFDQGDNLLDGHLSRMNDWANDKNLNGNKIEISELDTFVKNESDTVQNELMKLLTKEMFFKEGSIMTTQDMYQNNRFIEILAMIKRTREENEKPS
ncbi:hypothetical protein DID80_04965 [Candidatus Marinamargulisbacteria bacterium SCGC AAA071-K20]|nr:hypothetical protein DID80_04965 [Candidatus Marinamargulisbacteria bacterium SCGC AAA071-K20]